MRNAWKPLVFLALMTFGLARGEDSPEEARAKKVRELLELSGTFGRVKGDTFQRGGKSSNRFILLLHDQEVYLDLLVPIYAKHIDDETLDAALAFFRSPAGRKYMEGNTKALVEWTLAEMKPESEVSRALDRAAAEAQCKECFDKVMTWKLIHKQMPSKLEDLQQPIVPGAPEMPTIRDDPWGRKPVLHIEDGKARVVCFGPDGVEGTDDDIVYPKR